MNNPHKNDSPYFRWTPDTPYHERPRYLLSHDLLSAAVKRGEVLPVNNPPNWFWRTLIRFSRPAVRYTLSKPDGSTYELYDMRGTLIWTV